MKKTLLIGLGIVVAVVFAGAYFFATQSWNAYKYGVQQEGALNLRCGWVNPQVINAVWDGGKYVTGDTVAIAEKEMLPCAATWKSNGIVFQTDFAELKRLPGPNTRISIFLLYSEARLDTKPNSTK